MCIFRSGIQCLLGGSIDGLRCYDVAVACRRGKLNFRRLTKQAPVSAKDLFWSHLKIISGESPRTEELEGYSFKNVRSSQGCDQHGAPAAE